MMPWFEGDFLKATLGWTFVQRSLYRCLLGAQWELGSLPNDESELSRIAGTSPEEFAAGWPRVKTKFDLEGDRLTNAKLEAWRADAIARRDRKRRAGKVGGEASGKARTKQPLSNGSTVAEAEGQAETKPPSPSPSPSVKEEDSRRGEGSPAKDLIWTVGVDLLTRAGDKNTSARSFLGKLCRDFGDDTVREAVGRAAAVAPADPKSWLQGALKHTRGAVEPPRAI